MPKHKKDKHAQSLAKGFKSDQQGVPPTVNGQSTDNADSKAFQQQDETRRLGDFEGTGNHARTGNRGHQ